jgi:hypothetical protein
MHLIQRETFLWQYLQPEIRELITDGELLVHAVEKEGMASKVTDFSFLVFPFAKAYEGFLKKLFLDTQVIKYDDYYGDDIRIGRILNPGYQHEESNVFARLCTQVLAGQKVSEKLWETWKNARNLTFHYFPHNYKRLSFEEALALVKGMLQVMEEAVVVCGLAEKPIST